MIGTFSGHIISILVLSGLILLGGTFANAQHNEKTITRHNGILAYAAWHQENPDGSASDVFLWIIESGKNAEIFIELVEFRPDGLSTSQLGYVYTSGNVFEVSGKFKTATLSPINLELCDFDEKTGECVPRSYVLKASWEGIGDVHNVKIKTISDSDSTKAKLMNKVSFREAIAIGNLGNIHLGESVFAELGKFKTLEMIKRHA